MKLLDFELSSPAPSVARATAGRQWMLVRLHGDPVGVLQLADRRYAPGEIVDLALDKLRDRIVAHFVRDSLESGGHARLASDLRTFPSTCPRQALTEYPALTVAVCTRDRAESVSGCLDGLLALHYPYDRLELLVVDNAPQSDETERLVHARSPRIRYLREPRPGLDWARNRAALEARGEILAYTDDDVIVDRWWAKAIAEAFEREPAVIAVTGLVLPDETDTDAQLLFEEYGGFSRGVRRRYAQVDLAGGESAVASHAGTGKFGTGANMAFRRRAFETIGLFDPALDVGTVTNGGGDLEMFFRVLKAGHLLIYEPRAVVRHRHRREVASLTTQLANNGIGYYSYLTKTFFTAPEERAALVRHGLWWFGYWSLRRLVASFIRPGGFPRSLILAELIGSIKGLGRYRRSLANAARVEREFGPQVPLEGGGATS
jgi:GT2 family glycosyltransferase